MLGAAAILRELDRCAELDGGDGAPSASTRVVAEWSSGTSAARPIGYTEAKAESTPTAFHDPLLLPYT